MENNKFSMGAKIWKEMGALQEKEHDQKGAQASYNKAADCYEADNSAASVATQDRTHTRTAACRQPGHLLMCVDALVSSVQQCQCHVDQGRGFGC
jgi:hypothetical protein